MGVFTRRAISIKGVRLGPGRRRLVLEAVENFVAKFSRTGAGLGLLGVAAGAGVEATGAGVGLGAAALGEGDVGAASGDGAADVAGLEGDSASM